MNDFEMSPAFLPVVRVAVELKNLFISSGSMSMRFCLGCSNLLMTFHVSAEDLLARRFLRNFFFAPRMVDLRLFRTFLSLGTRDGSV